MSKLKDHEVLVKDNKSGKEYVCNIKYANEHNKDLTIVDANGMKDKMDKAKAISAEQKEKDDVRQSLKDSLAEKLSVEASGKEPAKKLLTLIAKLEDQVLEIDKANDSAE